ncbi:TonB-dependent receptor [Marixanthomonas spongiae]|uniref:TonB-dependent receptor n=2 Tax=Marixanthomonas spongiae TaxID=2174845 RepID=A0A2U0I464_9FLAO|nr:TonB-dependent receptor [Marixanthomonas spongiae]PVW15903.1 TonB-dependent receptor [Marixanthomonas spongiae]
MNLKFAFLFFFLSVSAICQTEISGVVTQKNGTPISGANVYLEGTYDGTTTDDNGRFTFTTSETGEQTLVVSFVSFEPFSMTKNVGDMQQLIVRLREDVSALDTVIISAGTFEAGDNSKVSVLKPLDVVTTASALGDFVGALQTLPGTTTVSEDGRLFVRGGDAGETQIFIDGIRVFEPYTPSTNNIPTRGRYSPFLFDGITFSTGGYSAEYGQALSSVLLLNTIDFPDQEKTEISVMSLGGGVGNTQIWGNNSLSVNANYINLAPYNELFPDRNDWQKPFETIAGESVYRHKFEDGLLKIYGAFDATNFQLTQEDINVPKGVNFKLNNQNFYTNTSYSGRLDNKWRLEAGGSFTLSKTEINVIEDAIEDTEKSAHLKLKLRKNFSNRFKMSYGVEQFLTDFNEDFKNETLNVEYGFNNNISAAFTEADVIFSKKFAIKLGLRGEYSQLFDAFIVSPRISLAYKVSKNSQLSLAYGDFYQQPLNEYLKFQEDLEAQKAQHYILNYQYSANNRIFRAELYRKEYDNLVTYASELPSFDTDFNTNGNGFAQGFDLFLRDNESLKNMDYWVSYSYLDTERKYKNYPTAATPNFANSHNLSVVGKYWLEDWKSQVGFSYQYGSGRTYTNANVPGFLQNKTKAYNSISLNWAYLLSQQKILYFSVNNVLGFKNVNGYQYANTPTANGDFARRTLRPAADQFFFVGFFWTISDDGEDNQLDNL